MDYKYKDNYPFNIEAPQKLYIQYSQDITFTYTGDNYPLGETHEGFIWESVYNPVSHDVDGVTLGRHVWMRVSIGDATEWTLPIRITDKFTNIESSDITYDTINGTATFRFKYVLEDGTIIYSDPITIQNGVDGRGITDTAIVTDNLVITYSDGEVVDLGRVTGYDGTGIPFGSPDGYYLTSQVNVPTWSDPTPILNATLTATTPLVYSEPNFSHLNTDGNKHVLAGGNNGDTLTTDGSGNYTWVSLTDPVNGYIPWSELDDTAGAGDITKLFSADHITSLISGLSLFGIKYSETTKVLLDLITGVDDELGVVTADVLYPNRTVFKWSGGAGGNWGIGFFDLDATHNHDAFYYTETELNSSGAGGQVHWGNVTNKPSLITSWDATGDSGSVTITDGDALAIIGAGGITTALVGNTLTLTGGATYTAGAGLDLVADEFSHEDTSTLSSISYPGSGIVINGVTVDTFGHLQGISTINLDSRFAFRSDFINHKHWSGAWNVASLGSGWTSNSTIHPGQSQQLKYDLKEDDTILHLYGVIYHAGTSSNALVTTLGVGFRPVNDIYFSINGVGLTSAYHFPFEYATNGELTLLFYTNQTMLYFINEYIPLNKTN